MGSALPTVVTVGVFSTFGAGVVCCNPVSLTTPVEDVGCKLVSFSFPVSGVVCKELASFSPVGDMLCNELPSFSAPVPLINSIKTKSTTETDRSHISSFKLLKY